MKLIKIIIISIFFSVVFTQSESDFFFQKYFFNENSIGAFYLSSFDMVTGATDIDLFRYGIKTNNSLLYQVDD